jgi:23S rRNA-/tRNA-specific pseudouridylate synthase
VSGSGEGFWAALPLGRGVALLACDCNGVAAFAKPSGTLSHPNKPGDEPRSLLRAPYDFEGEYYELGPRAGDPESPDADHTRRRLWLLNRLDSATSGVILAVSDEALAAVIRAQFKKKQIQKAYLALVFGKPAKAADLWRDRLAVEKQGGRIRTSMGSIPAESRMSVVRTGESRAPVSLIRLEPRTGRSHQLRVQCARRGLPIVGDRTYGDFARNREWAKRTGASRMFLHSFETRFSYEFGGGTHEFAARAPVPPEFEAFL